LNIALIAFCAGLFTYFVTLIGASTVFLFKKINKDFLNISLALAAGIMLSAAFFSLLKPAIDNISALHLSKLNLILGFLFGGLFLYLTDILFNRKMTNENKRLFMLFTAITIHNIPEGLAIGIAFGSLAHSNLTPAIMLTIGIAIQNFPEGALISLPMRREGKSLKKSFFYGQISAIVEPVFSFLGAILVLKIKFILPFALSFAAGAMIFVTVSELIPEALKSDKKNLLAIITLLGFTLMMILDLI